MKEKWITLAKWRTKGDPKIDKNESFGQLCQATRRQRIEKALEDQQASGEANSFSLRHDKLGLLMTILRGLTAVISNVPFYFNYFNKKTCIV